MKMFNYIIIMIAMMLFLEFTGIHTGVNSTLSAIGVNINQEDSSVIEAGVDNSTFFKKVFDSSGIFALLLAGGAIIVGLFGKQFDTSLVIVPMVIYIGTTFISTFGFLLVYTIALNQNWLTALVCTIFIPLEVGFIISVIDWFGGDR